MSSQPTKPCGNCPFLIKNAGMIRGARAREFVSAMRRDVHFDCHKTIDYSKCDDEGDRPRSTKNTRLCAGSMIVTARDGTPPSQLARIYERIGMYEYKDIEESDAACFADFNDFITQHTEKELR